MNSGFRVILVIAIAMIILAASFSALASGVSFGMHKNFRRPITLYITLIAEELTWKLSDTVTFKAWAYNGTIPGPTIDVNAGDTVILTLINKLPMKYMSPVSIHVHGLDYNIASSGTFDSGSYAEPSDKYVYVFKSSLSSSGTWMYHDHVAKKTNEETMTMGSMGRESVEGIEKGLYGAIIIRDPSENKVNKEYVIIMDEWFEKYTGVVGPDGMEMYSGFNGKTAPKNPVLTAKVGELVRIRLISIGTEPHSFHLHGHKWLDEDTKRIVDVKSVAPFETYTFTFTAGQNGPGDWLYHCHDLRHLMEGMDGVFKVSK